MDRKILSFLGIAMKAGKVASGEYQTETAVKSGHAFLVIIADDASANTKKKFENMCKFRQVPCIAGDGKEVLGRAIGRQDRAILALLDERMAATVMDRLKLR